MTALCLPRPTGRFARLSALFTPAVSSEGGAAQRAWINSVNEHVAFAERSLEEQLNDALWTAVEIVQEQSRYISAETRRLMNEQLAQLLSIECWDDDDAVLSVGSVRTMLRAVIELEKGPGDLSISRAGNLVSTWSVSDHVLRMEAHASGSVAWTVLHPRGSAPRHEHHPSDSIQSLRGLLQQLAA
jgi:hypothetical protein